uniref:Uncharacterized protein n=1 Tax=Zea mays TaxID=4577 RepID=A0A804MX59_MAIZE
MCISIYSYTGGRASIRWIDIHLQPTGGSIISYVLRFDRSISYDKQHACMERRLHQSQGVVGMQGEVRLVGLGKLGELDGGHVVVDPLVVLRRATLGVLGELGRQERGPEVRGGAGAGVRGRRRRPWLRGGAEQRRTVSIGVRPVAVRRGAALVVVADALLLHELLGELALLVAAPGTLHEAGAPAAPLVRVVAERVLQALAVQALELVGHVLEVLGAEREGLHLRDGAHRARGLREVEAGVGHERPGEELLAAEVPRAQRDGAEEVGAAAVRGGALQLAADDEEHVADGVALPDDVGVLGAERGDEALADGVQQLLVHLREEGHAADQGQAEVALDLAAEVERQGLEDGLLVDAARGEPLVLEEAAHALLELRRQLAVAHPLLDVPALDAPLLQPHRHGLQVGLHVADEVGEEDEAHDADEDAEDGLALVGAVLQVLAVGTQVPKSPPEAVEVLIDEADPVAVQVEGIAKQSVVIFGVRKHALLLDRAVVMPGLAYGVVPALAVQKAQQAPGRHLCRGAVLARAHLLPARVLALDGEQIPESTEDMACQRVEKQVVRRPRPGSSRHHSTCLDDLGVQGYYEIDSWYVLDQHDHGERVVGAVIGRGCTHSWYNKPDDHLHAYNIGIPCIISAS